MPRPKKCRRVCGLPETRGFRPIAAKGQSIRHTPIVMTIDEFETVRLIDREGLNQEECAERMDVARTTAQAIYLRARRKLADALVEGRPLLIEGGEVVVCERSSACRGGCGCHCPHKGE